MNKKNDLFQNIYNESIEEYLDKSDWRVNENANSSYSYSGLVNNISGKLIANYWLDKIYSEEIRQAHVSGDIHIHDLNSLTGYCAGWSLRDLLNEGFNGVSGKLSCNPPQSFDEAVDQITNFLCILQTEWAGAQAFSSFDTYLAPYVFKDKLSLMDVKKTLKRFIQNLNLPKRLGQAPFTNITFDIKVPKDLKNQFPSSNNSHLFSNSNC